jgi:glycine betaine/choline ABC-type transport system substrate-binding protein
MQEGLDDVLKLQAESNRLKLTATDEMIDTFSKLEALTKTSMDKAHEFMGQFTEIALAQDHQRTEQYQTELKELGRQTQETATS